MKTEELDYLLGFQSLPFPCTHMLSKLPSFSCPLPSDSEAPLGKTIFLLPSGKQHSDLEEKMISNQCNPFEEKDEVSNSTGFIVKAKPSVVTLK